MITDGTPAPPGYQQVECGALAAVDTVEVPMFPCRREQVARLKAFLTTNHDRSGMVSQGPRCAVSPSR